MSTTVNAGDIVLTTLGEALTLVKHKKALAQRNLESASLKVTALEKAIADYNDQLVLDIVMDEDEKNKKKR